MRFPFILFLFAFLLHIYPLELMGQERHALSSDNRRARRAYERAGQALRQQQQQLALEFLEEAIARDQGFMEAYLLKGETLFSMQAYQESIDPYRQAAAIDAGHFPPVLFYLGSALLYTGQYAEARQVLDTFLSLEGISESLREKGTAYMLRCDFGLEAVNHPVPFDPRNPGPSINSIYAEYSPALTADEKTLVFTRKQPFSRSRDEYTNRHYEDFYISHYEDGRWTPAENLGPPINTAGNEGAQTITADGRLLFFTACNRADGFGSCDIYFSRQIGGEWEVPENAGRPLNSSSWDAQPAISPDGRTIYFASNRAGSLGAMDLWKATRNESGGWSDPENLGPVINTSGREMSPFIHPDNQTLYFASDGHMGLGGLDIFYSRRGPDGEWTTPVNIGYPINTHEDEFAFIVGASGEQAWFSAQMEGAIGERDLYTFDLYPDARPEPVTYMKGVVADAASKAPLSANFELIDIDSGERLIRAFSDPVDGSFLVAVPTGRNIALNVSKEGYLFFSAHFSYADVRLAVEPHLEDLFLQAIEPGAVMVLQNVFFDTDSYRITESSGRELLKLVGFMHDNPGVQIKISGHTDDTGNPEYNIDLSEKRAGEVRNFLVNHDVAPERIMYVGYGETRPVASNDTAEGRARNRRTTFRIVSLE